MHSQQIGLEVSGGGQESYNNRWPVFQHGRLTDEIYD